MLEFKRIIFSIVFFWVIFPVTPHAGELIKCIGNDGEVSYSNDGTVCHGSQARLYLSDEDRGAEGVAATQNRNETLRAEISTGTDEHKAEHDNKVVERKAGY